MVTVSSVPAPYVCVTCRHNWPLRRGCALFSQVHHQTPLHRQPAPASTCPTCSAEGLLRDLDLLPAGQLRSWQSHHGALPLPALLSGKLARRNGLMPMAITVLIAQHSHQRHCYPPQSLVLAWELGPEGRCLFMNKVYCNKHSSNYSALFH